MRVFVAILLPLTSPCQTSGSFCQPKLTPLCPHCWPSVSPFSPLLPLFPPVFVPPFTCFPLMAAFAPFFQLILYLSFLYILIFFPLQSSPQFPFFTTSYFFFCFVLLLLSWCTLIIFYQLHVTLSKSDLSLTSSCCLCCLTI